MNTKRLAIVAALLSMSTASLAQQSQNSEEKSQGQTSVKASDAAQGVEKPKEDIDEEITNARMRAETGAKKKYSMSFNMSYYGGNFASPLSKTRPDIMGSGDRSDSLIAGSFGGRYRVSKSDSVSLSLGMAWATPFRATPSSDQNKDGENDLEIADPSVSYSRAFAIGKLQNSIGAGIGLATNKFSTKQRNEFLGYSLDYTALGNIWDAIPLTTGMAFTWEYQTFKDEEKAGQIKQRVGAYPFAEYSLTDKLNLRTVFRPWVYYQPRRLPTGSYKRSPYTQSFGMGISVARDFYLYPNFQFTLKPFNEGIIEAKDTNVGINAIFNL